MSIGGREGASIDPSRRDALLAVLAPYESLVLAVSGGADSLALMHLVAEWRAADSHRQRQVAVATVDHRLREGSETEAARVKEMAAEIGFEHETLVWTGVKRQASIQRDAREARYALLTGFAGNRAAPAAIVTAHTADDQAETVLMRLARGSGLDGLAAMALVRAAGPIAPAIDIVRPLLSVTRAELEAFLRARGVTWIDDPSNADPRFERVRLREARPALDAIGLDVAPLTRTARRLGRARSALEALTDDLASSVVETHGGAYASIRVPKFMAAPEELRLRLLARLLTAFGGVSSPPTMTELEDLTGRLEKVPACRVTLGGCLIRACGHEVRIFRETGRLGLPSVQLSRGSVLIWDDRFRVAWPATESWSPASLEIRALAPKEAAGLRAAARSLRSGRTRGWPMPARAAVTLPAIWEDGRLISVPGFVLLDEAGRPKGAPFGLKIAFCRNDIIFGAELEASSAVKEP
ncbi:MAG: tRNA lysidine(34) synthetase TilS [Hyphomicrobium sp.]|nr:tRNA lysidine(34) synthetase TilS [Hyphomicrobium sp.]